MSYVFFFREVSLFCFFDFRFNVLVLKMATLSQFGTIRGTEALTLMNPCALGPIAQEVQDETQRRDNQETSVQNITGMVSHKIHSPSY